MRFISNDNPRFDSAKMNVFTSGGEERASVALTGERGVVARMYFESVPLAQAVEDIFNGNVEGLAERIEEVLSNANDIDMQISDFALHVACDLLGKDVDEAYRERKDAAA